MEFPAELKYTKDHEWIKLDGDIAIVGITIVYVEVETTGETLEQEVVFGTVEAVKTVSDLFMPISGTISEFNDDLENTPELINEDPYEKGWIIKIEIQDKAQLDELLSADDYKALVA